MANRKYKALVGIDHEGHRAEPGDVIQWLPEDVAEKLEAEGLVEHYTKAAQHEEESE